MFDLQTYNIPKIFMKEIGQKRYVPYDQRLILDLNLSPNAPEAPSFSTPAKDIYIFPQRS